MFITIYVMNKDNNSFKTKYFRLSPANFLCVYCLF